MNNSSNTKKSNLPASCAGLLESNKTSSSSESKPPGNSCRRRMSEKKSNLQQASAAGGLLEEGENIIESNDKPPSVKPSACCNTAKQSTLEASAGDEEGGLEERRGKIAASTQGASSGFSSSSDESASSSLDVYIVNVLPWDFVPGNRDIICGMSSSSYHGGNDWCRGLVVEEINRIMNEKEDTKTSLHSHGGDQRQRTAMLIKRIVTKVKTSGTERGNFVRMDPHQGRWIEVPIQQAYNKVLEIMQDVTEATRRTRTAIRSPAINSRPNGSQQSFLEEYVSKQQQQIAAAGDRSGSSSSRSRKRRRVTTTEITTNTTTNTSRRSGSSHHSHDATTSTAGIIGEDQLEELDEVIP